MSENGFSHEKDANTIRKEHVLSSQDIQQLLQISARERVHNLPEVTNDQQAFVKGFMSALQCVNNTKSTQMLIGEEAATSSPRLPISSPNKISSASPNIRRYLEECRIKEEATSADIQFADTLKAIDALNNTPDIEKLSRKRLRNREAACRCRNRKIRRIITLREQSNHLKRENNVQKRTLASLQDDVSSLKLEIRKHLVVGCTFSI